MSGPAVKSHSGATPTRLASRIHAVTVYRSGARVTRIASLPSDLAFQANEGALRFDDLPLSLMDSSLRCRLTGSTDLRATDLQCELRLPKARETAAGKLEEEIQACHLDVLRLQARESFLEDSIKIGLNLGERGKPELGSPPPVSPLRARLATLEGLNGRLENLHRERAQVSEELRVAEGRLDELRDQLSIASSDRQSRVLKLRKSVVVSLRGSHAAGQVELEYFVPGARWAPSYALRLGADLRTGGLAMRAMVSQRSGEDWSGVDLTLSTADHQQWAEIPELNSKRIGRRQPSPPKKGWRAPPLGTELLYRDYDATFGGPSAAPVIGGMSSGRGVMANRMAMPVAAAAMPSEPAYDSFDGLDEEEFDAKSTQVMDSPELEDSEVFAQEEPMPAPAAAPMRSMAPRPSPPRQEAKKKTAKPRLARNSEGLNKTAGGSATQAPAAPVVELDLLQYARLRMPAPSNQLRGSLRIVSQMEVYAELFVKSGAAFDGAAQDVLARAESLAHDIAAIPTGHVEPWSEGFDYAYRSENAVDLASDGQFHSLPMAHGSASCTPMHVVVPRESTDVFRTVVVDNPLSAPLLAGPMDVYWDDAFLLTSAVAFTAPKGKVELGLGVDQSIKVVRNTHYREDTAGLMGGSLALSHKIVVEVANEGGHDIQLEVRERVPVPASDEDDIKLDIKSVAPPWGAFDPSRATAQSENPRGMYRWQIAMQAGERTELCATYEIKLPSKYELSGGNRREW